MTGQSLQATYGSLNNYSADLTEIAWSEGLKERTPLKINTKSGSES
jgi:hypothetical protein